MAAGDRGGNLRVYDLETGKLVSFQEAHDSEILTLNYLESSSGGQNNGSLLASGGRDRLIHLYDVSRYGPTYPGIPLHVVPIFEERNRFQLQESYGRPIAFEAI